MMENITIRPATESDAEEILNIYAPYVTDTAITFEYDVPTLEEFTGRIRHTLEKYPYLVAVKDGEIIGYAYAGAFMGVQHMTGQWKPRFILRKTAGIVALESCFIRRWKMR